MNEDVMAPRDKTGTRGSTRRDTTVVSPPRPATKPSDPGMGTLTPSERLAARQSPKPEPYNPQPLIPIIKSKIARVADKALDKKVTQPVADVAGVIGDTAGLLAGAAGAVFPEPVSTGIGAPLAATRYASLMNRLDRLRKLLPSRGPGRGFASQAQRNALERQTRSMINQKSGFGGKIVDTAGNRVVNFLVPHGRSSARRALAPDFRARPPSRLSRAFDRAYSGFGGYYHGSGSARQDIDYLLGTQSTTPRDTSVLDDITSYLKKSVEGAGDEVKKVMGDTQTGVRSDRLGVELPPSPIDNTSTITPPKGRRMRPVAENTVRTLIKTGSLQSARDAAQEFENSGAGEAEVSGSHVELKHSKRQVDMNVVANIIKQFRAKRVNLKGRDTSEPQPKDLQAHVNLPTDRTLREDVLKTVSGGQIMKRFEREVGKPPTRESIRAALTHTDKKVRKAAQNVKAYIALMSKPTPAGQNRVVSQ